MIHFEKISDKVVKESNDEYENDLKIVAIINEIQKIIDPKNLYPSLIKLEKKDIYVAYDLINIKIEYFREQIFSEDSIVHFLLTVFETFFIKENGLNFENLEEKFDIFDVIFKAKKGEPSVTKKMYEFIENIKKKKNDWCDLIDSIRVRFTLNAYLFCATLNYAKDQEPLLEFIRIYLELLYTDFDINFTNDDLRQMEPKYISKDFALIISPNHPNYFELYIENGRIKEKLIDPKKTSELIEGDSHDNIDSDFVTKDLKRRIVKKKKPKRGQKKRNKLKGDNNEIVNSQEKQKLEQDNKNKIIKEDIKEDKKKQKVSDGKPEENIIHNNDDNVDKYNNLLKRIELLEQKNEEKEKQINDLKRKSECDINDLKRKNKENEDEINDLKGKNERLTYSLTNLKIDYSIFKSNLNLVKSRTGLKSFIDFFYRAIGHDRNCTYEERVDKILQSLKNSNNYNTTIIKSIETLLKESLKKLCSGNSIVHELDDDINETNIISYLFKIIDPDNKNTYIITKLEKANVNNIIMDFITTKGQYYYDIDLVESKEKKIIENKFKKKDLDSIFMSSG